VPAALQVTEVVPTLRVRVVLTPDPEQVGLKQKLVAVVPVDLELRVPSKHLAPEDLP